MSLIDLIFPKSCLGCGKGKVYICSSCLRKVPKVGWHDRNTFSVWRYKGVIKKAVISLKYKYSVEVAHEIADKIAGVLKRKKFRVSDIVLIPIPLYRVKKNLRGFNQCEEVGRRLSLKMKWAFIPDLLVKTIPTKAQEELTKQQRERNLKGSFKINSSIEVEDYLDKTIFLFDDVYTTGSTLKEGMNVLKESGIKKIYGLTICR